MQKKWIVFRLKKARAHVKVALLKLQKIQKEDEEKPIDGLSTEEAEAIANAISELLKVVDASR